MAACLNLNQRVRHPAPSIALVHGCGVVKEAGRPLLVYVAVAVVAAAATAAVTSWYRSTAYYRYGFGYCDLLISRK